MSPALLQPFAWCAAFWTALLVYACRASGARPLRFACALALGAGLAHLGWLLLHLPITWPALRADPRLWFDPSRGACVLFVPLGLLLLERSPPAFRSLPLALGVARLGCVFAGCCLGAPTDSAWAVTDRHPTALYEGAGMLLLHHAASRAPARLVAPVVLGGIGALRLALEPVRSPPPLGAPSVPPEAIAAAWLGLAAVAATIACRAARFDRILNEPPPAVIQDCVEPSARRCVEPPAQRATLRSARGAFCIRSA